MWLTLLIIHLVIVILILVMFYWIYKRKTKVVRIEKPKSPFTIKLNKIKNRLESIRER